MSVAVRRITRPGERRRKLIVARLKERVLRFNAQGDSVLVIAAKLPFIPARMIRVLVGQLGLEPAVGFDALLRETIAAGLSKDEIAAAWHARTGLVVTRDTITRRLRRLGLPTGLSRRSRSQASTRSRGNVHRLRHGLCVAGQHYSRAEYAAMHGWGYDVLPHEVGVMNALWDLGPLTKVEIARRLGVKKSTLNSRKTMQALIRKHVVIVLDHVKLGQRCGITRVYSLSFEIQRLEIFMSKPNSIVPNNSRHETAQVRELPEWLLKLRESITNSIKADDIGAIMSKQVEKAKDGDTKAASFCLSQAHKLIESEERRSQSPVTIIIDEQAHTAKPLDPDHRRLIDMQERTAAGETLTNDPAIGLHPVADPAPSKPVDEPSPMSLQNEQFDDEDDEDGGPMPLPENRRAFGAGLRRLVNS